MTSSSRPYTARVYQQDAIDKVVATLTGGHDRALAVLACGTGKTLIAQRVVERLTDPGEAPLILCLYPNLALLAQNVANWQLDSLWPRDTVGAGFRAVAFCSEEQTRGGDDDVSLADAGLTVPNTTSAAELARWAADNAGHPRIVFATYQSSGRIPTAHKLGLPSWDVAVFDEAHRTAGAAGKDNPDRVFGTALDNRQVPARKRVFFTATPRIHKPAKDGTDGSKASVVSMDDPAVYGPRAVSISFLAAVRMGVLQPFDIALICINDDNLLALARGAGFDTVAETGMTAGQLTQAAGAICAATRYGSARQLVFHSTTITESEAFAARVNQLARELPAHMLPAKGAEAQHVDGATRPAERAEFLRRLDATEPGAAYVLTNVRCMTEGIDVPNLDSVMFTGPKRSTVDVVQAIGRACRRGHTQQPGHRAKVILSIYVGAATDLDEAIETSAFKDMYRLIRSIADMDQIVEDYFTGTPRPAADLPAGPTTNGPTPGSPTTNGPTPGSPTPAAAEPADRVFEPIICTDPNQLDQALTHPEGRDLPELVISMLPGDQLLPGEPAAPNRGGEVVISDPADQSKPNWDVDGDIDDASGIELGESEGPTLPALHRDWSVRITNSLRLRIARAVRGPWTIAAVIAALRIKVVESGGPWWVSWTAAQSEDDRSLSAAVNVLFSEDRWAALPKSAREELLRMTGRHAPGEHRRSAEKHLEALRAKAAANGGQWWVRLGTPGISDEDRYLARGIDHLLTEPRWSGLPVAVQKELLTLTGRPVPGESRLTTEQKVDRLRDAASQNGGQWWKEPAACATQRERNLSDAIAGLFRAHKWAEIPEPMQQEILRLTGRQAPARVVRRYTIEQTIAHLRQKASENGGQWWVSPSAAKAVEDRRLASAIVVLFTADRWAALDPAIQQELIRLTGKRVPGTVFRSSDDHIRHLRAKAAANGGRWWPTGNRSTLSDDERTLLAAVNTLFTSARWPSLSDGQRQELMQLTGRAAPRTRERRAPLTDSQKLDLLRSKAAASGGRWWKTPRSCADRHEKSLSTAISLMFTTSRWTALPESTRRELMLLTGKKAPVTRRQA